MAIEFAVSDAVATITINRPERLNAMDAEHYAALSRAWIAVRDDPAIRVAIVTGAGERSFTTGADLKSFIPRPAELADSWLTQRDPLLNRGLEVCLDASAQGLEKIHLSAGVRGVDIEVGVKDLIAVTRAKVVKAAPQ